MGVTRELPFMFHFGKGGDSAPVVMVTAKHVCPKDGLSAHVPDQRMVKGNVGMWFTCKRCGMSVHLSF